MTGAPKLQPGDLPFVALVVLTIAVGIAAYDEIGASRANVRSGFQARLVLQGLSKTTLDEENAMRGYVQSGNRVYLRPYEKDLAAYRENLAALRQELARAEFAKIRSSVDEYDRLQTAWSDQVVKPLIASPARTDRARLQIEGERRVNAMMARADSIDRALIGVVDTATIYIARVILISIGTIVFLTVLLGTIALRTLRGKYCSEQRLRAQIAERNTALERSNQALQEFAYVASHDLQEPLRTVASFTSLLQRRYAGSLDAQADEYISHAVEGAQRMQTLINDILLYSRVTTHGKALQPTGLREVVDAALENLRTTIEERNVDVVVGSLPSVLGDASQLTQLFQNIIANAIKYNATNKPRIEIRSQTGEAFVTLRVVDNGIGVDSEYHERIFRVFSRLHTRAEYPGTGIGLAICKRIVERHGGRIWVESSEGHGATISFTLRHTQEAV